MPLGSLMPAGWALLLPLPEVADWTGVWGSACPAACDDFLPVVSSLGLKEWKEPRFNVCLLSASPASVLEPALMRFSAIPPMLVTHSFSLHGEGRERKSEPRL